nr:LOW QUALITY PROTEIN: marginal zone B- and B1-cell-specific protein [Anas platyrhynchos]|eukprot:XP_027324223.1 marginal zone B- and B1-cell-specific protein [Anas platyrhynchos]
MRPVLAACVALSLVLGPGAGDGCEDPQSPSFSRSVPAPQLSAEELHSPHMPQALRCDACYAIAFQLEEQLSKAEAKLGRKALRESDYVEVLERSCSQSWELYGVQELNGEKRLTGPGLQSQQPLSVVMTGGPWPSRLAKMCHSFVGEQGEEQLYGAHRRGPSALRELLCHGEKGPCAPPAGGKAGRPAPPKALQNEL